LEGEITVVSFGRREEGKGRKKSRFLALARRHCARAPPLSTRSVLRKSQIFPRHHDHHLLLLLLPPLLLLTPCAGADLSQGQEALLLTFKAL
jgi:hypothetical protein